MIGRVIHNYKITHFIGKGNMGKVYLAKHISLGKQIAIKALNPKISDDEELRNRFYSEAKVQAYLDGISGIVEIYDFIEDDGDLFILMEFLRGVSLDKHIKVMGPMPENEAIKRFIEVLQAVNEAHQRGVIHRDLKPSNIMYTEDSSIKIMDFGIAKIIGNDTNLEELGLKIGSPKYMSPEQKRGEEVDIRTDIYSLGLVFYEMLTGRVFSIDSKKSRPKLSGLKNNVILQSIIDKSTQANRENRFNDTKEIIRILMEKRQKSGTISLFGIEVNKFIFRIAAIVFLIFIGSLSFFIYSNHINNKTLDQKSTTKNIDKENNEAKLRYKEFLKNKK